MLKRDKKNKAKIKFKIPSQFSRRANRKKRKLKKLNKKDRVNKHSVMMMIRNKRYDDEC
jgi:hypothetical protein